MAASRSRVRRGMDRRAHLLIGAAAADIGDAGVDIFVRRLRLLIEERCRRHDHAGLAIAALRYLVLDPGLLHLLLRVVLGGSFVRGELLAFNAAYRNRARSYRHSAD